MKRRRRQGFTLVEIMIVLAILVLLIAMVGPRLLSQQDKSDLQQTELQIKNVENALKFYKVEKRKYPSTEQGLKAVVPFLDEEKIPTDPWGNKLRYAFPPKFGRKDQPNIWSVGPDGKDSTEDDITSWEKNVNSGESEDDEFESNEPSVDDFASDDLTTE